MNRFLSALLGGRLQVVLVASFSLVAALTVGLNALAVSQVIRDYLETAEADLVARDMDLANAFYQLKLDEVAAISYRLALDPWVSQGLVDAVRGDPAALALVDQQITNKITVLALGGTHLIGVLDVHGSFGPQRTAKHALQVLLEKDGNLYRLGGQRDIDELVPLFVTCTGLFQKIFEHGQHGDVVIKAKFQGSENAGLQ